MPRWSLAFLALFLALPAFAQKKDPDGALAALKPGDGLKVELFAAEPMVINPTSIDVDHKGRVWVAEAVNYRRKMFRQPMIRKEGDRIQVLIDEKGEGKATKAVTFYQGEDLYGPLSVLVIPQVDGKGLRVLVAQSPDILEFTDADGDLKADGPPKKFLTGFQGFDHDHGVHGLHLGPDGKLYFTVGDSGVKDLQSSDGKGKKWTSNGTDCQKGTVWRCNLDGKNLELIAHNFRNNYEACVDSFGEIWLSDNDDDGNEQTRICFVMPGGNYGYGPRGPGQSHWHEEQPGVVHKVLRTGFGSPTGIQFYEGTLLPKQYHNTLMHCDAGPREVRAFTRKPKGAGYELDKALMLSSSDTWFRPSDVCTAPDGSVFVADWYDKRVGGHGMDDPQDGRIYRLTPKDHKGYKVPEVKLDTKEGFADAFRSSNMTTRHMASSKVRGMVQPIAESMKKWLQSGGKAEGDPKVKEYMTFVDDVFENGLKLREATAEVQARWLWATCASNKDNWNGTPMFNAVGQFSDVAGHKKAGHLPEALIRIDRDLGDNNVVLFVEEVLLPAEVLPKSKYNIGDRLKYDPKMFVKIAGDSPAARRELLLTLRHVDVKLAAPAILALAQEYDGSDHFYRAALNIACGTDPERRDKILADFEKHFPTLDAKALDLVWELRPKGVIAKLPDQLLGNTGPHDNLERMLDVLGTSDDPAAVKKLLAVYQNQKTFVGTRRHVLSAVEKNLSGRWAFLKADDDFHKFVRAGLDPADDGRMTMIRMAGMTGSQKLSFAIRAIATNTAEDEGPRIAAVRGLAQCKFRDEVNALAKVVKEVNEEGFRKSGLGLAAVESLGAMQMAEAVAELQKLVTDDKVREEFRRAAVGGLAASKDGTAWLLKLREDGKFPEALEGDARRVLRNTPFGDMKARAARLFPLPGKLDPAKLPAVATLAQKKGSADRGKAVLAKSLTGEAQCLKCHTVRGTGGSIGPDLSMIGKKGGKDSLYDSLLSPSKAIADQYISWRIDSDDGQSVTGLLVEETPTKITVRDANGKDYSFDVKGVTKKKSDKSIMPDDVIKAFTEDELIDVVEYLSTLQTPSLTPDAWQIAGPFPAADDKALDADFGPEKGAFDAAAKFKAGDKELFWRTVRGDAKGYFDLAAFHGTDAPNSVSYLYRVIESPADQEVTILLGTDDGCRLFVNGQKVFGHDRHDAATPGRDAVKVKLKKGANAVLLKVNNGDSPHGFYLTLEGGADLKLGK